MSKGMLGMLPLSAVRGPVGTLYENLAGDDGKLVLAELNRFNRREPCWVSQKSSKAPGQQPLLVFSKKRVMSVALDRRHVPGEFWKDTDEVPARRVWGTFTTTAVVYAEPSDARGIVKIPYANVRRATNVREILGTSCVGNFTPTDCSTIIAAAIAMQPKGEPGKLLNDGRENLFPCNFALACVDWDDVHQHWDVNALNPDFEVDAGRRVFSGNLIH